MPITLRIYWINYEGRRHFYAAVRPHQSYHQQTYLTHPWVLTNENEDCLAIYMPTREPRRVSIDGKGETAPLAPQSKTVGGNAASAAAQNYKSNIKGPAAPAVERYIETSRIDCDMSGKGAKTCPLTDFVGGATLFYGKMPDDPADYAVAFVTHESAVGGNAVYQIAIVLKAGPEGAFAPFGQTETIGTEPRDVRFESGAISYTGTVLGPGEPRCCPTAKATFRLLISAAGLRFVDLRQGDGTEAGASQPAARSKAADYLIREQISDACERRGGRIDPAAVIERDLTGDGKADLIISHEGITCTGGGRSSACGMQVCSVMIYVREGPLLKLAVGDLLGMMVTVDAGRIPTVRWRGHGGSPRAMRWNGGAFR
ncbi:hypothetical protein LMTR13_03235 [Bradyrhizobium icense]|uniref:von Hippel-Lindau disease tumour suppressor beta domain-containing protein n=2 Tax=Bradyrhizobium icense TaxID=1274631 RepID=A0A1B1U9G4_9BRAD|nr:hypothetical protein LMTR13_03235 [Bradyrhizobium icense]